MFLEFFGLREQPFGVTPDPKYLYLSQTHREALVSLTCGVQSDRGFMALISPPGMGKTTLLYQLLDQLRDSARTVFLFQTQCTSREFFRHLLSELGVDSQEMDLVAMHDKLNEIVFAEMLAGKRFVLVVDEAQNLHEYVLETVRLLSDFETPHAKLLQIVLAGQPQLAEKLSHPDLLQLRQRIAILNTIEPLNPGETAEYIEHRLRVAGYSGGVLFSREAMLTIADRSQGIPRNINNLCFNAMSLAYQRELKTIEPHIVQAVVKSLDLGRMVKTPSAHGAAPSEDLPPAGSPPAVASTSAVATSTRRSTQLTYPPVGHRFGRWAFAIAIVASILLLIGALSLAYGGKIVSYFAGRVSFLRAAQANAREAPLVPPAKMLCPEPSPESTSTAPTVANAAAQPGASRETLTVVAGPQQTLKEISLLYLGRFDQEVLAEVCTLNPEARDFSELHAGRQIQLPLPPGALKKGYDSAAPSAASKKAPGN